MSCRVASDFVRRIVRGQERPRSTVGNSQSGFIKEKEDAVFGTRTLCVRVSDARELGEPAASGGGRERERERKVGRAPVGSGRGSRPLRSHFDRD